MSLVYLLQERQLKAKRARPSSAACRRSRRSTSSTTAASPGASPCSPSASSPARCSPRRRGATFWSWEPVQVLSVLAWLLYAVLLQTRSVGWRGRRAATLTIVGFALLIVSFLSLNLGFPAARRVVRLMQHEVLIVGLNHRTASVDVRERWPSPTSSSTTSTASCARSTASTRPRSSAPATASRWSSCTRDGDRRSRSASPTSCASDADRPRRATSTPHLYSYRGPRSGAPSVPRRLEPRLDGGRRAADPRPAEAVLRPRRQRRRHRRGAAPLVPQGLLGRQARAHRDRHRRPRRVGELGGGRAGVRRSSTASRTRRRC